MGQAFDRLEDVLAHAARAAEVTHNHPEGIKGAQATAAAVFLARQGESKTRIKAMVERVFGYDLHPTLETLRPAYGFDVSCQGTVPPALIAFLESSDFEDAVRKGHLTRWGCRHVGLHRRRCVRSTLRRRSRSHQRRSTGRAGRSASERGDAVRRTLPHEAGLTTACRRRLAGVKMSRVRAASLPRVNAHVRHSF